MKGRRRDILEVMDQEFFFYDLETSGLDRANDRIMQFAGQRTDAQFNPIGEPVNVLVALNDDTLPSPGAVAVTGITPQRTQEEGYSEADFARLVVEEFFTPGTIIVGYNTIRFDDEFIRHLLWRNFYDPYEWSYKQGNSRWDLLDVVRMTRALRPEGIVWPVDASGRAVNKLELITQQNGISHDAAHDALSDVRATIDVARLIRDKQPKLFEYLLNMRHKSAVAKLVDARNPKPVVYSSGRYDAAYDKTTVVWPLAEAPHGNVLVYDLRHDPEPLLAYSVDELQARLFASYQERQAEDFVAVPVKPLPVNKCPAVAPIGVLGPDNWQHLDLSLELVQQRIDVLRRHPEFASRIVEAFSRRPPLPTAKDPEAQLYDGFITSRKDITTMQAVRQADGQQLKHIGEQQFEDPRLKQLIVHYKARNFPFSLSSEEKQAWQQWRADRLQRQSTDFVQQLQKLAKQGVDDYLLTELQLWFENVMSEG